MRLEVAERQLAERGTSISDDLKTVRSRTNLLGLALVLLFDEQNNRAELHHRPALVNRRRYVRNGKVFYDPPANSAEYLVYLLDDEHDIETRVRGQGAQLSDLAIARKRKRKEKKATRPKRKWPSRPLRSATRWPKRKIQNRRKP